MKNKILVVLVVVLVLVSAFSSLAYAEDLKQNTSGDGWELVEIQGNEDFSNFPNLAYLINHLGYSDVDVIKYEFTFPSSFGYDVTICNSIPAYEESCGYWRDMGYGLEYLSSFGFTQNGNTYTIEGSIQYLKYLLGNNEASIADCWVVDFGKLNTFTYYEGNNYDSAYEIPGSTYKVYVKKTGYGEYENINMNGIYYMPNLLLLDKMYGPEQIVSFTIPANFQIDGQDINFDNYHLCFGFADDYGFNKFYAPPSDFGFTIVSIDNQAYWRLEGTINDLKAIFNQFEAACSDMMLLYECYIAWGVVDYVNWEFIQPTPDFCTLTVSEIHAHFYSTDYKTDGTYHWKECPCGNVAEKSAHNGGTATCTAKAVCSTCGVEYGSTLEHSFGNIIRKDEVHTPDKLEAGVKPHYHCSMCEQCFDIDGIGPLDHSIFLDLMPTHKDTDNNAKCDECNGTMIDHTHTYGNLITDGLYHWKECPCGNIAEKSAHNGGSATCTAKAVCSACGVEYGSILEHSFGNIIRKDEVHTPDKLEAGVKPHYHCSMCEQCFDIDGIGPLDHSIFLDLMPTHKDTDNNAKCDECNGTMTDHTHTYGNLITDGLYHWKECPCGDIQKSAHNGGTATCTAKAVCSTCGVQYGNTLPHVDTDNNAKCDVCSVSIADHTHTYGNWITDGSNHWRECPCGDIQKSAHNGGTATCTTKAVCSTCGVQYGNSLPHVDTDNNAKCDICSGTITNHRHSYSTEMHTDSNYHWKECPCGAIDEKIAHGGGRATCTDKAKCSTCGVRYGNMLSHYDGDNNAKCDVCSVSITGHTHIYGNWITDGSHHWKECSCGNIAEKSAHSGGTATCTTKAVCSACGVEYGSALGHVVSDKWSTTEIDHYKYCSRCALVLEKYDHIGGTATCTAKAVCSTCGAQYGSMLNHKDHDNNAKCDICNTAITTHIHNYGTTYQTDGSYHWKVCSCGNIAEKSAHSGGVATCINEAKCSVCNVRYGSLGNHNYTSATCTTLSKCTYCNERVGELRDHTDKDRNSICDDCGYLLIADTDTEQMKNFLINEPSNKATSIKVGESLYYTLWNDDVTNLVRTYYNSLCTAPDDYYPPDSYYQQYTRFTNYVDVIQGGARVFGFEYNRAFLDDGSNPSYRYNPYTDSLYNRVEVILTFYKDGSIASEYDISAVSYSAYGDDGIVYSINGFMFNNPGTYEVTMYVNFINDFDSSLEVMSTTQIFSVELANSDIKVSYDKGYADGYKIGFENGKLSDDDFSFYGFINAIINAPSDFIDGMLDFNVFGVHMASFVKMLFTLLLVAFVVIVILKVVI